MAIYIPLKEALELCDKAVRKNKKWRECKNIKYFNIDDLGQILCEIANKCGKFIEDMENQPATDVAPVVHGRWMTWEEQFPGFKPHINDKLGVFCSLCHAHSDCISPYCPNCGAKMDIDEEE